MKQYNDSCNEDNDAAFGITMIDDKETTRFANYIYNYACGMNIASVGAETPRYIAEYLAGCIS